MAISLFHILNISRMDMLSKMNDLDVVSGNVSNGNTIGYKSSRANFQELLDKLNYEGVHQVSTQIDTRQGSIRTTGNQLDVAIQGDGFFAVTLGAGKVGYTRDGQFQLDAANRLVTPSGYPVVWTGTIPLDAEEVQIQENGVVRVKVGDNWNDAGSIPLSRFPNPTGLQINGNNVYVETVNSGKATSGVPGSPNYGTLMQSTLEESNINMAEEMTHLITLQRGFQLSTRIFQATDTMLSQAIHVRKA